MTPSFRRLLLPRRICMIDQMNFAAADVRRISEFRQPRPCQPVEKYGVLVIRETQRLERARAFGHSPWNYRPRHGTRAAVASPTLSHSPFW